AGVLVREKFSLPFLRIRPLGRAQTAPLKVKNRRFSKKIFRSASLCAAGGYAGGIPTACAAARANAAHRGLIRERHGMGENGVLPMCEADGRIRNVGRPRAAKAAGSAFSRRKRAGNEGLVHNVHSGESSVL